jgi:Protein of unknown function (DUF2970)
MNIINKIVNFLHSLLMTVKAVLWSFIGIRKKSGYEHDINKLNPVHIVIVAVLLTAGFIYGLLKFIKYVVLA